MLHLVVHTITSFQDTEVLIDETAVDESKVPAEESEFIEPDILDTNIETAPSELVLEDAYEEDLIEEVHNKSLTQSEEQDISNLEEEEEEAEEGLHFGPILRNLNYLKHIFRRAREQF